MINRETHNDMGKDTHHRGPGGRLRQAREALNLSLEEIARNLHLTTTLLHELEHNQFNKNTNLVFTRGYLRAYAAHLNLPADEIVHEFDQLGLVEKASDYRQELSYKPQRELFDRLVPWLTGGAIALVMLAGYIWWHNYSSMKPLEEVVKQAGVSNTPLPTNQAATPTPPADSLPANALTPAVQAYPGLDSKPLTANPAGPGHPSTAVAVPAAKTVPPVNTTAGTPGKSAKTGALNDLLENRHPIPTSKVPTATAATADADENTSSEVTPNDGAPPVKHKKKANRSAKPSIKLDAPF
jgi:cytoskeleton protein RodZ